MNMKLTTGRGVDGGRGEGRVIQGEEPNISFKYGGRYETRANGLNVFSWKILFRDSNHRMKAKDLKPNDKIPFFFQE